MAWLKSNWRWAALNLFGISVLTLVLSQGSTDWNTSNIDPGLESGKWAIRFLLICLAMTPLNIYFGWRSVISLRKPTGLWAFGFAALHVVLSINGVQLTWLTWPLQPFIAFGLLGLLILTALALTSNRWAMRRLRKNWKRLHRLIYLAGSAGAAHMILATAASKKMFVGDPEAIHELKVYVGVFVVLLVVRIPLVRRGLKQTLAMRPPRQAELPVVPVTTPARTPKIWPQVYGYVEDKQTISSPEGIPVGDNEHFISMPGQSLVQNFFRQAVRIDIGSIEEIDARLQTNINQAAGSGQTKGVPGAEEVTASEGNHAKTARRVTSL